MRSLKKSFHAAADLSVVLMIGIAFLGLMITAYIIFTIRDKLQAQHGMINRTNQTLANITTGFDDAVALLLVAITIFILAIAISALLMLRQR